MTVVYSKWINGVVDETPCMCELVFLAWKPTHMNHNIRVKIDLLRDTLLPTPAVVSKLLVYLKF